MSLPLSGNLLPVRPLRASSVLLSSFAYGTLLSVRGGCRHELIGGRVDNDELGCREFSEDLLPNGSENRNSVYICRFC